MSINAISRRNLLAVGTCTLVGASGLLRAASVLARENEGSAVTPITFYPPQNADRAVATREDSNVTKEQLIRKYYSGWEKRDWGLLESTLTDSFTFTSPNDDDHINKSAFKTRCWPQAEFIERFELESVVERDNEGFVKYLCRTTKGTSFRNLEYFRFAGGRISAIEVYFGGRFGYPTASISGKPS